LNTRDDALHFLAVSALATICGKSAGNNQRGSEAHLQSESRSKTSEIIAAQEPPDILAGR
jgi:hypothetical protein